VLSNPAQKQFTAPNDKYSNVNRCIYCGTLENLTDEHIIPYGLGGRSILPKASCSECSNITTNFELAQSENKKSSQPKPISLFA
jgi:5-methylcytosine-specific restriction endonuclease McrA